MKARNFLKKYNSPHDTQTMWKLNAESTDIKITTKEIKFLTIWIFFCPMLKFNWPSNLNYVTLNNDQVATIQVFIGWCVVVQNLVITEFAALIYGYVFSRCLCHLNEYQYSSIQFQKTTSIKKTFSCFNLKESATI